MLIRMKKMHISYMFAENSKKGDYKLKVSLLKDKQELIHFFLVFNLKKDIDQEKKKLI